MKKFYRLIRYDWPLHFILLLTNWLPDNVICIRLRGLLAKPFFKKCGKSLGIGRNVVFYNPSEIEIGNWVYIAYGCWFLSPMSIIIEDEVLLGPYNVISTANHTRRNNSFRFGPPEGGPITLKRGCWIGAHCTILPGTVIGVGTVVGANTVVSGSVPDNSLYSGKLGEVKKNF